MASTATVLPGLALFLVARAVRSVLLVLVLVALVPQLWSWSSHLVRSDSMDPSLAVGDVVVAQPFSGTRVPVGRVMLFKPPHPSPGQDVVVHRVVENLDGRSYVTRGDNNAGNDPDPIPAASFLAQARICVPFVGLPVQWWREQEYARVLAFLLGTSLALWCAAGGRGRATGGSGGPRRGGRRTRRARLRRASRPGVAAVALGTLVLAVGVPTGADAAFSASTATRGLTWAVSTDLADSLVLKSPGSVVRGTAALSATLANSGGRTHTVRFQHAPAGTTAWTTARSTATIPYGCAWNTSLVAGQRYDLRAVATSADTTWTSQVVRDVLVDNTAPAVTMANPGTPLRGSVTLSAAASDSGSGPAQVTFQAAPTGTSAYQDLCVDAAAPHACSYDTTRLANGSWSFRAVALDVAGNTTVSAAVTGRTVDNVASTVAVTPPTGPLTGSTSIAASASSTAGVVSVRIQAAAAGSGAWSDLCTDTTSPYSCGYDTTTAPDGSYDLRAVLLDGAGRTTTSATVTAVVDNTAPRAADVQTTNGGVAGRIDAGDTVSYTYSEAMRASSIKSGWTGSATPVTLRVRDGNLVGAGARSDTLDVLVGSTPVNLGSVNLRETYVSSNQTATFNASMVASTVTVNGVPVTRVTVTIGAQVGGLAPTTVSTAVSMTWSPAAAATDLAGLSTSVLAATESGTLDRDF